MNITVVGASVGVGFEAVGRALELGHHVTALSRRKIKREIHPNLVVVCGSALNEMVLAEAISGADALLVTLGTGVDRTATTLYSDFAEVLLSIHSKQQISIPVIILTGFGSGSSRQYMQWFVRPIFSLMLEKVYSNKAKMEELIANSSLQWEFVRPGILTNQPLTEDYRVETELRTNMNVRMISRADVADYMVKEAVLKVNLYKYPVLTK